MELSKMRKSLNALQLTQFQRDSIFNQIKQGGGVSIDENTPIKTEVTGSELVPIVENNVSKAVSVDTLVKGGIEVYLLDLTRTDYSNVYNELKEVIENKKVIVCDIDGFLYIVNGSISNNKIFVYVQAMIPFNEDIHCTAVSGVITPTNIDLDATAQLTLDRHGNGTKFLSDDGSYKDIINATTTTDGLMSAADKKKLDSIDATDLFIIPADGVLPTTGVANKIYLIPAESTGDSNIYTEYVYKDGVWEILGEYKTNVDLSDYALKTDIPTYEEATTTTSGLMSAEDKTKLDNLTNANTSIVTQAEYDALVAANATSEDTIYYIRG